MSSFPSYIHAHRLCKQAYTQAKRWDTHGCVQNCSNFVILVAAASLGWKQRYLFSVARGSNEWDSLSFGRWVGFRLCFSTQNGDASLAHFFSLFYPIPVFLSNEREGVGEEGKWTIFLLYRMKQLQTAKKSQNWTQTEIEEPRGLEVVLRFWTTEGKVKTWPT